MYIYYNVITSNRVLFNEKDIRPSTVSHNTSIISFINEPLQNDSMTIRMKGTGGELMGL